jgi:hypothetical protein
LHDTRAQSGRILFTLLRKLDNLLGNDLCGRIGAL